MMKKIMRRMRMTRRMKWMVGLIFFFIVRCLVLVEKNLIFYLYIVLKILYFFGIDSLVYIVCRR